jgi:hypothetical protein
MLMQDEWFVGVLGELVLLRSFLFHLTQRALVLGGKPGAPPLDLFLGGIGPELQHLMQGAVGPGRNCRSKRGCEAYQTLDTGTK